MNYLNKYESFKSHEEIHKICKKYNIDNYIINSDNSIDVNENVNLSSKNLRELPLKFNHVSGFFWCISNNLTTLQGGPQSVGGDFDCRFNKLTTLEDSPNYVDSFNCSGNYLTTLEGAPQSVNDFDCSCNELSTLKGAPQSVDGNFNCSLNELSTLKGAPQSVDGNFNCSFNRDLKSLKYLPQYIHTEKVDFENTPVYEIFKLLGNDSLGMIRIVNDLKVVVDDKIDIETLNDLLYDQGKPPVKKVKGYDNI